MAMITFSQAAGFVEIPDPVPLEDQLTFQDWLDRVGYNRHAEDGQGHEDGNGYEIFAAKDPANEFRFLVSVGTFSGHYPVLVKDTAELMALCLKLAPFVASGHISLLQDLDNWAEKAFRAFHGHDPHSSCPRCDPEGYQRQCEARERLRKVREARERLNNGGTP